ncbi:MAG: dUTP diphosphatase [Clostridia bacterium]|nr:dUTP diphosphatase [Clostridia bacterium]
MKLKQKNQVCNTLNQTQIKIKKLNANAVVPVYGSTCAAGADLYALLDEPVVLLPNESKTISTGLAFEIPVGLVGLIFARSGLSCKQDLAPANKVGVIDADYRGEVMVVLHNHGKQERTIQNGDRIAQIAFIPYVQGNFAVVDELSDTLRGVGGFGHTGR